MKRPRFKVVQLMLFVVLVALLCRADRMFLLSVIYRDRARFYHQIARECQAGMPIDLRPGGRGKWADELAKKYWRAAALPWLPVEPDPPEPN